MGGGPADYLIEILPWQPGTAAAVGQDPVDVTDRATLEDMGSINRAVERDFLAFRTGDITLALINDDGDLDDLFAHFGATDRWQLRMFRRGRVIFLGSIMGQGSISFDRLEKMVEITAYGMTKVLDETTAETVKRTVADMTVTTATSGQAQITLNSTAGLLTGDVLHVTDHVNKEDITVKRVSSATVAILEANLGNTYASGSPVVLSTPFYRYKTPDFLVRALFAAPVPVPVAELKISGSLFKKLAPTPVNLSGLVLTNDARRGCVHRNGRWYVGIATEGSRYQTDVDGDWTNEDSTDRGWADWSPYYVDGSPEPPLHLRDPQTNSDESGVTEHTGIAGGGYDFVSSPTRRCFGIYQDSPDFLTAALRQRTTTDGTTWGAFSVLSVLPVSDDVDGFSAVAEYDPTRNIVVCSWYKRGSANGYLRYWDLGGSAWVDMKPAGDAAGVGYFGPRYVADIDAVVCLKATSRAGPAFSICAFRGAAKLWERPFPSCNVAPNVSSTRYYPSRTVRWIGGSMYAVAVSDGAVQLIRTDDDWRTYVMREIAPATSDTRIATCKMNGTYRIACYLGTVARGFFVCAPFYAGVINYADFQGKSRAEALQALATVVNATFWTDDDFQAHFVARDQVPAGDVPDLTELDLISEQSEIQMWDEVRLYVEVSGGGATAVAGDPDFAADGLSISSEMIPNEAYAQALADQYVQFYNQRRAYLSATVIDDEDLQLHPMRRAFIDGRRFYVHESDHSPTEDEWSVKFLEDLEDQPAA